LSIVKLKYNDYIYNISMKCLSCGGDLITLDELVYVCCDCNITVPVEKLIDASKVLLRDDD